MSANAYPQTQPIAVGDLINASIRNGVTGGNLAITNISSAVSNSGQQTIYTITAGGFTFTASADELVQSTINPAGTVRTWVVGKQ